jgi:hypothetical protein
VRDSVQWLRDRIKQEGYKHWRVVPSSEYHERATTLTAYKTSPVSGVQYTLRGRKGDLDIAIEHIERGERA